MIGGKRFYGKYRGKVADNIDPLFLGRILPIVPAVSEAPLTWATPCVPYAGMQVGLYAIPPLGANVWIEFEGGDPNYPIWSGCFWEEGQVPLETPAPGMTILKTEFITLILNDDPEAGGLTLEITPPAVDTPITLTLNSSGIEVITEALLSLTSDAANITSGTVTVEAASTFNGEITANGAVTTNGEVTANGAVTTTGELTANGAVTTNGEVTSMGEVTTVGALLANGEVNIAGSLSAEGNTLIAGGIEIEGGGEIDGVPII